MTVIDFILKCGFRIDDTNSSGLMYKLVFNDQNLFIDYTDPYWISMTMEKLFEEMVPSIWQEDLREFFIIKTRAVFIDEILLDLA